MEMEYRRFGDSFVCRKAESADDWKDCVRDDVPAEFFEEERKTNVRRDAGMDPFADYEMPEGGQYLGSGNKIAAVRLANPAVDAMAIELGLTSDELRQRLNGTEGGTRARVAEDRFDEIAGELGLDPQVARDRFADRG